MICARSNQMKTLSDTLGLSGLFMQVYIHICSNYSQTSTNLLTSLGLSVLLLTLDSPAGYICRIYRSNMLTIPSTVNEFGKGVLPVIVLVWKAKVMSYKQNKLIRMVTNI